MESTESGISYDDSYTWFGSDLNSSVSLIEQTNEIMFS